MEGVQVLVVTQCEEPGRSWGAFLARRGWMVKVCRGGGELRQAAGCGSLNLVLLDEALAGELPAGAAGKRGPTVAVILFSSTGTLPNKKIAEYLQGGFDDFIASDIDLRILEAKLLVNLRWALPSAARTMEEVRSRSGRIRVNKPRRIVFLKKNGGCLEVPGLTRIQLEILALLVGREGAVVERRFIVETVWRDKEVNFQNVDKHVEALRAKLACFGRNIETVYGAGYRYREDK